MTIKTGPGQELGAEGLAEFFARTPRLAVAFSGGCDSSYLLAAAVAAGCDVKAYMVDTAFQPAFELEDARRVVEACGAEFEVIEADVLAEAAICANPAERCYLCKRFIFGTILERMARDGYDVLADGTNASDDPARRPGFRALAELGVVSPLRRAGMTKDEVRAASRALGAPTADKPSFSCLATKVPEGEPITEASLDEARRTRGL
ncbi:7-cyano-7-deazaguanine synthase [Arabiibacter massiliensis]|uniref:7-cyano-7-deazaguanine synthase n=1 Tax=Arabiibacter massiliensis TaxID=1870985 RepID=UPI0009BB5F14|nr:7-cyano-7-deazaguanine synthase [Arabiibacter massiliensis]